MKFKENYLIYIVLVLYIVGITAFLFTKTQVLVHRTSEVFLFVTVGLSLALHLLDNNKFMYLLYLLLISLTTLIIEIIGVRTSAIFGAYSYGSIFRLQVFNVPLIIGLNWVFVIVAIVVFIKDWFPPATRFWPRLGLSILAGIGIVLFDVLLEPVAVKLNYWHWQGGQIPLQNYISWFIIGTVAAFSIMKETVKGKNKLLKFNFILQIIFFFIIRNIHISV